MTELPIRLRSDDESGLSPQLLLRQALTVAEELTPMGQSGYLDQYLSIHVTRVGGLTVMVTVRTHRTGSPAFTVFQAVRGSAHDICPVLRPGHWTERLADLAALSERIRRERERCAHDWLRERERTARTDPASIPHRSNSYIHDRRPADDKDIFSGYEREGPEDVITLMTEQGAGLVRPGAPLVLREGRLAQPGSEIHPLGGPAHPLTIPLADGEATRLSPGAIYELAGSGPDNTVLVTVRPQNGGE